MSIHKMLDKNVRQAVKSKVLKDHINDPYTLVIEELGLDYGSNRVDIAVINGEIHGYELKSDSDNLLRLPKQAECYSLIMDKVTLVVGEKHVEEALHLIPDWWGVKIATMGQKGGVHLKTARFNKKNRNINPVELLKLVWKEEVLSFLSTRVEVDWRVRKMKRKAISQLVVDSFTVDEIRNATRTILKSRTDWRSAESQK